MTINSSMRVKPERIEDGRRKTGDRRQESEVSGEREAAREEG